MKKKAAVVMLLVAAAVCAGLLFPMFVLRALDVRIGKGEILIDNEMTELTRDRTAYYEALAAAVDYDLGKEDAGNYLDEESAGRIAAEILRAYVEDSPESYCPKSVRDGILSGSAVSTCLPCSFAPYLDGIVWYCEWYCETDGDSGWAVLIDDETGLLLGMAVYGQMGPADDDKILGDFYASCCRMSFGGTGKTAADGSVGGRLLHFSTEDGQELELPLIRYENEAGKMLLAFNMPGTSRTMLDGFFDTDAILTEH